jgi:transcription termination/antitermination protein NusG
VTEHEEDRNAIEGEETEPATTVPESDVMPEALIPPESAEDAAYTAAGAPADTDTDKDTDTETNTVTEVETQTEPAAEPADQADQADQAEPVLTEEDGTAERAKRRWYVVHTYSGHENKVKANLERAIHYARMQERFGEILVATEDYAVMKAGKKQITKRKTFPSYVLVEMAMDDESRALVQNIPGVTHFVGDKRPTALTEAEVRRIRGEEVREVGKVTTEVPFKVGESVKVTQGPFADFVGSVDEINLERGKLRVMVSIFGRATAVELDLTHVTSI